MTMSRLNACSAAVAFALGLTCSASVHAAVVDNFETYAPDSSLASNGWTQFGGSNSYVYPGSVIPDPPFPPLEGSQSVYVSGQLDGRGWGTASSSVVEGATLSWLVKVEVAASVGQTWFFLSQNAGTGGGGTPAGIILDHDTSEIRLFGTSETASGESFVAYNTYKFEMDLDFTNDQFTGYVTDITGAGSKTLLGTMGFASALDVVTVAADGGVILGNVNSGSAAFWDDVQIVPEPASFALLAMGGVLMLTRRRT